MLSCEVHADHCARHTCERCSETKRKDNKHRELGRDTSTLGLRPSRERASFVLQTCPTCPADVLSNLCGWLYTEMSPEGTPSNPPQDTSEAYRPLDSLKCFLFIGFSSPLQASFQMPPFFRWWWWWWCMFSLSLFTHLKQLRTVSVGQQARIREAILHLQEFLAPPPP